MSKKRIQLEILNTHTHTQNKRKVWVRIWLSIVFFDKVFVWFFTGQVYHNYAQLPWTFAQLRQTELNLLFIIQSINQTIGISINSWRTKASLDKINPFLINTNLTTVCARPRRAEPRIDFMAIIERKTKLHHRWKCGNNADWHKKIKNNKTKHIQIF